MNGFEMHGIGHLSPSSLNLYASAPALWVMERLLGKRAPVGCAAHRGTAAEHGVSLHLFSRATLDAGLSVSECQQAALKEYDKLSALSGDPKRADEREALPGLVEKGIEALAPYGIPSAPPSGQHQHKVEIRLEGVPVPVIGFKDFVYDQHGITVDLKTQLRLASEINPAHARQGAVYVAGTNHEMRFTYVTPKKHATYKLEDVADHLAALTQIAVRLERFLRLSRDKQELAGLVVPDYQSFYYNEPTARANARAVFGF